MRFSIFNGLFLALILFFVVSLKHSADPAYTEVSANSFNATASITGTVNFKGEIPKLAKIKMDAEPSCSVKHKDGAVSDALVLGKGNTMANVLVKISKGLPKKDYPAPKEPVVLDQNGCMYSPHVFAVMAGQPLKILNSDGILHNVHPLPKTNRKFNLAMPKAITSTEKSFPKVEETPFVIKCDVHPWMKAYAAVMGHPFYSVTGKDGKFNITGLEPGTYEVEAWHEKMGTLTASVTVKAGESAVNNFVFERK